MLNIVYSKIVAVLVFFSVFVFLFSTPTEVKAESSLSKIYTTYIIEPGVFAIETLNEMFATLTGGSVNLLANTAASTSSSNIIDDYIIEPLGSLLYSIFDFSVDVDSTPSINSGQESSPQVPSNTNVQTTPTTNTTPPVVNYYTTETTGTGERGPQGPKGDKGDIGPRGPAGADAVVDTSNFVNASFFDNQVDGILGSIEDGISGINESIGEGVNTDSLVVSGDATISGNLTVAGTMTGTIVGNAGTATALQTARSIYGNNFDGTADLSQIIASTFGGTGNGFTKFTGPTTAEKTFTLPDSSATLLYSGGALGTPSSGVATNLTGTASGLTAGNVTTNANLTGVVTSVGNATAIADAALSIAKTSGLQTALDLKSPLASPTFTGTVTIPTPFTLGATSVTSTGTQFNYLNAATGTTGTTSTNLVFSTSPTLVTPILGTPQSVTLTNATGLPASAVLAGTFGTGAYVMDTSLTVPAINGSTAANGDITINGTSDSTKTSSYVILQETGGNVGIGTAGPASSIDSLTSLLEIGGTVPGLTLDSTATAQESQIATDGAGLDLKVAGHATASNNFIRFFTEETDSQYAPTERLRIDSAGNIGVGFSSAPTGGWGLLSIKHDSVGGSSAEDTSAFKIQSPTDATTIIMGTDNTNDYSYLQSYQDAVSWTNRPFVLQMNGGNVGIGTTAPDKALEINSATGNNLRLTYNDADGSAANYSDFTIGSTGGLTLTAAGTNPKTLVVNNGTSTGNIFEAQDNGTAVFTVADGGAMTRTLTSSASVLTAGTTTLNSGYTGTSGTWGGRYTNNVAGTGTAFVSNGDGNIGLNGYTNSSTSGTNIGLYGMVQGYSTGKTFGVVGLNISQSATGDQYGGLFATDTEGSATVEVGLAGILTPGQTGAESFVGQTAALLADNTTVAAPIFIARDNGTAVFTVADGGGVTLGLAGTTKGVINFSGNTSGVVTIQPAAAAGTYTLTLPTDDGTPSQYLQTDGSGSLSWATVSSTIDGLSDAVKDTTSQHNMIIGTELTMFTGATGNLFIGESAGTATTSAVADNNLAIGYTALDALTSGRWNTALGSETLTANTSGQNNLAVGYAAMTTNTIGENNIANGSFSLFLNLDGNDNTVSGVGAMFNNTTGDQNTVMGSGAFSNAVDGNDNVAIGNDAGLGGASASPDNSIFIGTDAGRLITTGGNNVFIGHQAGNSVTTGGSNIVIGYDADVVSGTGSNQLNIGNAIYGTGILGGTVGIGIGTSAPDKALEINSATGANLRLTYNDSNGSAANYSDFTIGSTGGLTLTAAGTNPKTLVVNNGTSTGNIFEAQDNGTAVFTVADGGNVSSSGTVSVGGTTPNSDIYFYLDKTGTLPTGSIGNNIVMNRTDTGGGTNTAYRADIKLAAATTATTMLGMNLNIGTSISGATLTTGQGLQSNILNVGGATLSNATGGYFGLVNVGTATTWKGTDVSIVNAGTIGTTYGMYVGDITSGTQTNTPFSFYASDVNALNYFGGSVGIGETSPADLLHITTGNVRIGASTATRSTTAGTNQVILFDGTAPVGTLTNGVSLYSTAGELRVLDAAGNETLLSPHENENNYWVFDSSNSETGKSIIIDMELMMKRLNDTFGWDFVHETIDGIDLDAEPTLELPDTFFGAITNRIVAWFADASNGITDMFAVTYHAKEEICINETCINEEQLKALLQMQAGGNNNESSGGSDSTPEPTPEEEEIIPTPEESTPEDGQGGGEEVIPEEVPVDPEPEVVPEETPEPEPVPEESAPESI